MYIICQHQNFPRPTKIPGKKGSATQKKVSATSQIYVAPLRNRYQLEFNQFPRFKCYMRCYIKKRCSTLFFS